MFSLISTAQLAGAAVYTDCSSVEAKDPHQTTALDMTLKYLELWGIGSIPSLPSLPGPLLPWVVTPDGVLSMSQNELLDI